MKRVCSILLTLCMLLAVLPMTAQAGEYLTREIDGNTYYDVTEKHYFYGAVQLAFSQLTENLPVCYIDEERNWDSSYSNDSRNFTGIQTKSVFNYAGYSPNTVCITPNYQAVQPDGTTLCYGTIDITYSDSKEELQKADAIIDGVLAKIASYPLKDKLLYIADYVCAATEYGFQEMPGGGYDLINGVYEVLTGVRTNIVCTSYALTYQRFMEKAGVHSYILSNNYHAWNIVQVDGEWYGVDCTSDNGSTIDRPHFLMGSETMRQYATDQLDPLSVFGESHTIAKEDYGTSTTTTTTTTTPKTTVSTAEKTTATTVKKPIATTKEAVVNSTAGASVTGTTAVTTAKKTSLIDTSVTQTEQTGTTVPSADGETTTPSDDAVVNTTTQTTAQAENAVQVVLTEEPVALSDHITEDCDSVILTGEDFAWRFAAADVDKAASAEPLDATIYLGDAMPAEQRAQAQTVAEQVAEGKEIYPFSFAHHGALPGKAEVTLTVDTAFAGKTVGVYSISDAGEAVLEATATVDEDGKMTFATSHCSVWFIAEQEAAASDTPPRGIDAWLWWALAFAVVVAVAGVAYLIVRKRGTAR